MMEVFVFKADVRARDVYLQFLNDQCRRTLNENECKATCDVIMRECTFVKEWSDVSDVAVRIVLTKAAELKVMKEFLCNRVTSCYRALDEVRNGVVWEPAGDRVTRVLNNKCYEYDVCELYVNAVVRMTYNDRQCSTPFSQGQIAVVVRLSDVTNVCDARVTVKLAPPGIRQIVTNNIPESWPEVVIRARTTPAVIVETGLQMGRRTQLPLRFYICSTIHRIQGETLPLLATQVTDASKEYRLWQKEQLAVLISRMSRQDVIFVGSREEMRIAIMRILACSSKWDNIVNHYLSVLDVSRNVHSAREVDNSMHLFLPIYRELPAAECGYMYLMVSVECLSVFHVGHTNNIKKALRNVNTGYGDVETRDTNFHPWGVFAFVSGFEEEDDVDVGLHNR